MSKYSTKRISNISLSLIVFLVCFVIAEVVLRLIGFQTGVLSPSWLNFKIVDTLKVYNSFHANEKGVFIADKDYFKSQYSINDDGFRGNAFKKDSTKQNILFLGDSYTWGSQAEPISKCFVELVEKEGYNVYNTGIPGADPPQYYAIAQEYIPRLHPDIVCMMLYAGNDFISQDRKVEPYKNLYHITNAGWLSPYINNEYVASPEKVYHYYLKKYSISKESPLWERLIAKSVIGTLILSIPERLKEKKAWQKSTSIAVNYVKLIKQVCDDNYISFHLFLIPLHTEISEKIYTEYASIFKPFTVNIPENICKKDFLPWPNGHLTNEGHQKYAKCILKAIKEKK